MSSYQWYKDGTAIVGATNATYTAKSSELQRECGRCERLFGFEYELYYYNAAAQLRRSPTQGKRIVCGRQHDLSAPSGMSSYLWSNGETTASITTSTACQLQRDSNEY